MTAIINMASKRMALKINLMLPVVLSCFTKIAAVPRQWSIKRYRLKKAGRIEALCRQGHNRTARCEIFMEKGSGSDATIVIGGFVPDATEAVEFQRHLFRKSGNIYYMNFPRNDFSQEVFHAELADLIEELNGRGEHPTLFCISFGCGLTIRFLSDRLLTADLRINRCIFVSPVIDLKDMIRLDAVKTGNRKLLESILKRILDVPDQKRNDVNRHIEKGRRYFRGLIEAGIGNRPLTYQHLSIKKKVMNSIAEPTSQAVLNRILALKTFSLPEQTGQLFDGPVLILLAEREDEIFISTSPTLAFLNNGNPFRNIFPQCHVKRVSSGNAQDPVPHASLIFHHQYYNPIFHEWLLHKRLLAS